MISTKNLCLIEISFIEQIYWHGIGDFTRHYSPNTRYTLAKTDSFDRYIDVFTHTVYIRSEDKFIDHAECVTCEKKIITSKKFITKAEAIYIIRELNPSYLPEKPKTLCKKR